MNNKSYDKYFVIGFNKTATFTLYKLFQINNIKSEIHAIKNLLEQLVSKE